MVNINSYFLLDSVLTNSASRRKAHFIGFAFGASQAIVFFANSACFYFGSWLVTNEGLSYENMFKLVALRTTYVQVSKINEF